MGQVTSLPHLYPSYSYSLSLNRTTPLSSDSHDKKTHTGYFQWEFSKIHWKWDYPYSPADLAKNRPSFPRKQVIGGIERGTSRPKVFVFPLTCHPRFHTSLCGFQCECCGRASKRPKQGLTWGIKHAGPGPCRLCGTARRYQVLPRQIVLFSISLWKALFKHAKALVQVVANNREFFVNGVVLRNTGL